MSMHSSQLLGFALLAGLLALAQAFMQGRPTTMEGIITAELHPFLLALQPP